ncbi:proline rich protein membrane protein [Streptomyces lincolnensis]|uniref:Proline rich protein membrane protein n=1 Tax=Streptomyces lincolnensis TaxID=1915 RepID=A0A1B1MNM7_STRLN|nr:hypothetical protein [Streptomyces lincolnensis]ANS70178.1 proline rich protein membrane protein [Streptomyces lincolnensis]AXG59075.1 proline rich protein membrane protein [Streptomyces lincolnensis]QMV11669.1 hypothetical protein GJU35_42340 [Streptomyces lincolnensis]
MTKGRAAQGTKLRFWRWRRNPLRRRSDVTEAWIVLAVWAFTLLGGSVAGQIAAMPLERALDARRAEIRPMSAVVTQDAPGTPASVRFGGTGDTVWVGVRWTTADGATQVGRTKAEPGTAEGDRVTVWTDRTGALASEAANSRTGTVNLPGAS